MFKPQNFLVEAVSSKDLKKIRVALSTYLSKNPTDEGNEVTNVLKYVQQNFNGDLWEVQDERALEQDSSKWTKDYLGYLKSDLRNNFSKERFDHIIEVGKVVRKKKTTSHTDNQPERVLQKTTKSEIPSKVSVNRSRMSKKGKLVIGGILIVTVVTAAVATANYLMKQDEPTKIYKEK
ncbi:hypothetical protein PDJ82_22745 [Bacillus cereus group sp. TH43LC]|uniref:hypothetical protein n=1 Tax=Bacillus cereus group TaxID=86661 RepID=UPI000CD928DF|nr:MULTISPECIES: hypothetical protein [Bacillus cereus group]MCC2339447.1 hypothetical protein [Bacillus tropicus]MCU5424751.1 hypothetical protein [Bacillus tropicus]MDA1504396.1 hypothetical protein [Bacillus cereus group sp. TH43LC]MDA1788115.1 hypothetical protein [Bacillus cereus group sp. BY5-1LC]MDA1865893.1 hypothetical protein [Bacillus cereus group sp. BY128LC]